MNAAMRVHVILLVKLPMCHLAENGMLLVHRNVDREVERAVGRTLVEERGNKDTKVEVS
jgi:hypothetical protein